MRRSLFSPLWYRVSGQHPRLHLDVRVERSHARGQTWMVLIDGVSGRQFRVNDDAWQFVGRCDGSRTVEEVWDSLLETMGDAAPTQDEVIAILGRLGEQGLIVTEAVADAGILVERGERRTRVRRRGFVNPFAFRVSFGDPTAILKRLEGPGAALFRPLTLWLWCLGMGAAFAAACANWGALVAHGHASLGGTSNLIFTAVSFPFIKALHELCHALAVRRWGGEVPDAGVTLFVLMPAPYVDASASAGFRARSQRVTVGAAGLMCEMAIAAGALALWLAVQPGLLRDLAFAGMVTASVSTLLFNANPLLKFDGSYVFCDLFDLPNLAARSSAWWGARLRRLATGSAAAPEASAAPGETKFLLLYAPLSLAYRIAISVAIVLWIGSQSVLLGVAAGAFIAFTMVVKPLGAACGRLLDGAGEGRWRARLVLIAAAAVVAMLVGVVPLPLRSAAPGVVWLPEQALVRSEVDGFVAEVLARDGAAVHQGMVLMRLTDPALAAVGKKLARRREELETDRFSTLSRRDLARARNIEEEIARTEAEMRRMDEKLAQLEVKSGADGTLVMPRQQDLVGSFAKRGANLGYVLNGTDMLVRAAVGEEDAALVRERVVRAEVRLAGAAGEEIAAQLVRGVPAATRDLPSAALGERGGGPHAIDPADKDGLRTLQPVVLVDLALPARMLERVGTRAWVRFEHGSEPLVVQVLRRARQLLLRHFNPTG